MTVTATDAEYILNIPRDKIAQDIFTQKKARGYSPEWHIKKNNVSYVNIDSYLMSTSLKTRSWLYATDKLYWIFLATGHSVKDMSEIMAKRSKYFNDVRTWQTYLYNGLFELNSGKIHILKPTMLFEFIRIGTKYLYLLKKAGRLNEVDKSIFD